MPIAPLFFHILGYTKHERGGNVHELSKKVADYKSLKTSIQDLTQKMTDIENEIKAHMGDQEELSVDGTTVRWKRILQNRFDTGEFRRQHTALYEQFLTQSEIRRFTIT